MRVVLSLARASWSVFAVLTLAALTPVRAQVYGTYPSVGLQFRLGSSIKVNQMIGDDDWQARSEGQIVPVVSQSIQKYNIAGCGLGYSFEYGKDLIFLFGDTISNDPAEAWSHSQQPYVDYHGHDSFALSDPTTPEAGIPLDFYTEPDGSPLFVRPKGIKMGPFDVPNSGITLNGTVYIVCNTGSNVNSKPNVHIADWSVLTTFDPTAKTFADTGRVISRLNPDPSVPPRKQGHFIINAMHLISGQATPGVLMFGTGEYRASDIYLSYTPAATFASPTAPGTVYFTRIDRSGNPVWSPNESDAYPVVFDDPHNNQPAWPNDTPTCGNPSVSYEPKHHLWLMTFDGGGQKGPRRQSTVGIYFCYAAVPWGPWSTPQLIYNDTRDHGFGQYIFDPALAPHAGPAGPTIGWHPPQTTQNDPTKTKGGAFAPEMIERFSQVSNGVLSIFYTASTWNPYTVILMRSDFDITPPRNPLPPIRRARRVRGRFPTPDSVRHRRQ